MPTYLQRYNAGEREQVWDELLAFGPAVRDEPLYADALAVARETMTRARHNVELLVARLRGNGYKFAYPLNKVFAPPPTDVAEQISLLEELVGTIPLSIRVWFGLVGEVNLMGTHPDWMVEGYNFEIASDDEYGKELVTTEPLQVNGVEQQTKWYEIWKTSSYKWIFGLDIADEAATRSSFSGGNADIIEVPDANVDGYINEGQSDIKRETFVQYLRRSFLWGGFPGFAGADAYLRWMKESVDKGQILPRRDFLNFEAGETYVPTAWLAELTEGLLPI
jgi:hypothetical protein